MNVELGLMQDGDLALVSDEKFPADIKRVEYYRDQKLLMLVYEEESLDSELMHYELKDAVAQKVEKKSTLMIIEPSEDGKPTGYYASLIQINA